MASEPADIHTVGDLDPDREVSHTSHTGGPQRPVHLEETCRHLDGAKQRFSSVARVLDPDRDVCQDCAGTVEYTNPEGTDVQATRRQLSNLDPSDVGLSSLGDRSASAGGER